MCRNKKENSSQDKKQIFCYLPEGPGQVEFRERGGGGERERREGEGGIEE